MNFREQRGTTEDSMETLKELPDKAALIAHVKELWAPFGPFSAVDFNALMISDYFPKFDFRTNWAKTYVVTVPGLGIVGFTDSMP